VVWLIRETFFQRKFLTLKYKKGDQHKPANYKAISLLSIPGKIFSQVLLAQIKTKAESVLGRANLDLEQKKNY